jgi:hypothetical protein
VYSDASFLWLWLKYWIWSIQSQDKTFILWRAGMWHQVCEVWGSRSGGVDTSACENYAMLFGEWLLLLFTADVASYPKSLYNLHCVVWHISTSVVEVECSSRMLPWYHHLADNVVSSLTATVWMLITIKTSCIMFMYAEFVQITQSSLPTNTYDRIINST